MGASALRRHRISVDQISYRSDLFPPQVTVPEQVEEGKISDRSDLLRSSRAASAGVAGEILARLGLASVDRIVFEALRSNAAADRAAVTAALQAMGDQVQWLGRNIVYLREQA